MDDEMKAQIFEKGKQLALKWAHMASEEDYSLIEIAAAVDMLGESLERFKAIMEAFGDDADRIFAAMERIAVEEAIKEAEEAINGD